jgi:hypothetical protein
MSTIFKTVLLLLALLATLVIFLFVRDYHIVNPTYLAVVCGGDRFVVSQSLKYGKLKIADTLDQEVGYLTNSQAEGMLIGSKLLPLFVAASSSAKGYGAYWVDDVHNIALVERVGDVIGLVDDFDKNRVLLVPRRIDSPLLQVSANRVVAEFDDLPSGLFHPGIGGGWNGILRNDLLIMVSAENGLMATTDLSSPESKHEVIELGLDSFAGLLSDIDAGQLGHIKADDEGRLLEMLPAFGVASRGDSEASVVMHVPTTESENFSSERICAGRICVFYVTGNGSFRRFRLSKSGVEIVDFKIQGTRLTAISVSQ